MKPDDLTIEIMVFHRLNFLEQTEANKAIIASFALEVFYELDNCFKIDVKYPVTAGETDGDGNPVTTHVGDEKKYTFLQRSLVADLICVQLLILRSMKDIMGVSPTEDSGKIMTSAKAGSVEVKWEQVDVKKSAIGISGSDLLDYYFKAAKRKAMQFNCILDMCDDCVTAMLDATYSQAPFIVVNSNDCGCNGSSAIVEQG